LANCNSVTTIDVVPGNAGLSLFTRVLDRRADDVPWLDEHVLASFIDLAIVGTDELVAAGMGDALRRSGIAVVGPSKEASKVEWSKSFAKELMAEAGVATARSESFADAAAAKEGLSRWEPPVVVKADGLALGKGVTIARTREEAIEILATPPTNSGRVLLEELLEGDEVSLQALVDGETVVALPPARDHKRARDGDTGPNTGGMGAFSPTSVLPDDEAQAVAEEVIAPIAAALAKRGTPYRGVLYAGLMKTADGWRVLEYNARFGDPEAEVTLPRIEGDFAKLLFALGEGRLAEYVAAEPIRFNKRHYVDVVLCAENYPGPPKTGMTVAGLDGLPENVLAFHGATKRNATGDVIVNGGRVMHMLGSGDSINEARDRAYAGAEHVTFEGKFYRSDIAQQEVAVA
jgi:phosphoribosylamine--glycine ligase